MRIEGQVGPQTLADGTIVVPRLTRDGAIATQQVNGADYTEGAVRGQLFHASTSTAGVAIVAAGTTAGVALANPSGSGKNLSISRVALGLVSGTFVVGTVMHGVNTNTVAAPVTGTALTAIPGLIGGSFSAVGKPFATATLPVAQTPLRPFAVKNVTAATGSWFQVTEDVDGQIVLAPGATWSLFSVGADTTPLEIVGLTWVEFNI